MITSQQYDSVSQRAHFLGAACAVFAPQAIWGGYARYFGAIIIIIFAAVKEGWYDEIYEVPEIRLSGWRDFRSYAFGVIASLALLQFNYFCLDFLNGGHSSY